MSRFSIDIKHDTKHRSWKRLSVVTLSPEALDGRAYAHQYAIDNQMNVDQLAWRIVEIDSASVGAKTLDFIRVVSSQSSAATENRHA